MAILSAYATARQNLYTVTDIDFMFPKMFSSFEQGTVRHLLTISTPPKCLPADSYAKKIQSHLDSKELRAVVVNTIDYSSDSFKLGGLKYMGLNKVVNPVFLTKNTTIFFLTSADLSSGISVGYPLAKVLLTSLFKKEIQ